MIVSEGVHSEIQIKSKFEQNINNDIIIIGGGLSGVCAAVSAARLGSKVTLIQDRPVLGGNASSEVRLWILGATSHMGNNNRWSREGGIIDEILVENIYRNPEGNPVIFDTILLDKVLSEPNITLLLNTSVFEVVKSNEYTIDSVTAFCSQTQVMYSVKGLIFIDASGDGIVGFKSGAAFRMGAESKDEFGEKFAPEKEYGELLGHSLYFYSKDVGKPVEFIAPNFALKDITTIPRYKSFNSKDFGCRLWWIEYGGRLDTVSDTEIIKYELWKIVYGVWDYIKNSGEFSDVENLTLEWVGTIPGKRESRRFEGDYILKQQDIVEQIVHYDSVAYGGWSIDLHPSDGIFSEKPGCNQWHSKGIYDIPFRSLYSRNINNLLLGGRIISASHVAFGSTRVMATCGSIGQAVGTAAVLSLKKGMTPSEIVKSNSIDELQQLLIKNGVYLPSVKRKDAENLVQKAIIKTSSELLFSEFKDENIQKTLESSVAQMVPLQKGPIPQFSINITSEEDTILEIEFRISKSLKNYTPEIVLAKKSFDIKTGYNLIDISFNVLIEEDAYGYLILLQNSKIKVHYTNQRITGILSLFNHKNLAVSNNGIQEPKEDIGVDTFEFWTPKRRPDGQNIAFKISSPLSCFSSQNLINGIDRPTNSPNAWVADFNDQNPTVHIVWDQEQVVNTIELCFDSDFDHPMESVLMGHPERVMPFCIRKYSIENEFGDILYEKENNYHTRNIIRLNSSVKTKSLFFKFQRSHSNIPLSLFSIRCFN